MCNSLHPPADCSCRDMSLEVLDNEPPKVRPNGSREELAELAKGFAPSYTCRVEGCDDVITEGAWCVAHNARWVA